MEFIISRGVTSQEVTDSAIIGKKQLIVEVKKSLPANILLGEPGQLQICAQMTEALFRNQHRNQQSPDDILPPTVSKDEVWGALTDLNTWLFYCAQPEVAQAQASKVIIKRSKLYNFAARTATAGFIVPPAADCSAVVSALAGAIFPELRDQDLTEHLSQGQQHLQKRSEKWIELQQERESAEMRLQAAEMRLRQEQQARQAAEQARQAAEQARQAAEQRAAVLALKLQQAEKMLQQ